MTWRPGTMYTYKRDGTVMVTKLGILRARLEHVLTYSKDMDAALHLIDAVLTALTDPQFRREPPREPVSPHSDREPVRDQYPLHPTAAELDSDWLRRWPDRSPSTSSPLLVRDEQGRLYRLTPVEEGSK